MQKKQKRRGRNKKKRLPAIYRILFTCCLLLFLFYLSEDQALEEIKPGEAPLLYSNVCHDNLEKLFVEAIYSAQHSILLFIYSLSDSSLIDALNAQAKKGISVKVIHDMTTPPTGFQKLCTFIDNEGIKPSGLMHRKILIVDSEKVWIGSANMTTESLKLHDNLVIGVMNPLLAKVIASQKSFASFNSGGQPMEYWGLPEEGREGLKRLIQLIDSAQKTVRVAMFTWTHSALTEAIIRAHRRGIDVEVVLDRGQAQGVCQQCVKTLQAGGVEPKLSSGLGLLHHKFAWIDEEVLVNGSANWTQAAFTRNSDCFLILHQLTELQNAKMKTLWKRTYSALSDQHSLYLLVA
jgi:cardiolipin synthase